jgi:TonB family protein
MPKDFFKYLLWALGLHGLVLGIFFFSWPFLAQSVFPFDRPRIFKVSLVSLSDWTPAIFGNDRNANSPRKTAFQKGTASSIQPVPEWNSSPLRRGEATPVMEDQGEKKEILSEGSSLVQEDRIENKAGSNNTSSGHPSSTGNKKELQLSFSSPPGLAQGAKSFSPLAIPRYGENRSPYYPVMAREQGWQGTTWLKVQILRNGSVGVLEILRSSGYSLLDRSALKAVKDWKFIPAQKDGRPITIDVEIPVTFRLE